MDGGLVSRRAIFLDRDGTLIQERHFLHRPEDLEFIEGSLEALWKLSDAKFALVVVSNQSGVARGYFGLAEVEAVNAELRRRLAERGIELDGIYVCPHHPEGESPEFGIVCDCRKPAPGLVLRAAEELDLEVQGSWIVGDKPDDVRLSESLPLRPVLLRTGYGREREAEVAQLPGLRIVENLHEAARLILSEEEGS